MLSYSSIILMFGVVSYLIVGFIRNRVKLVRIDRHFIKESSIFMMCMGLVMLGAFNMSLSYEIPLPLVSEFLEFGVLATIVAQILFIFSGVLVYGEELAKLKAIENEDKGGDW